MTCFGGVRSHEIKWKHSNLRTVVYYTLGHKTPWFFRGPPVFPARSISEGKMLVYKKWKQEIGESTFGGFTGTAPKVEPVYYLIYVACRWRAVAGFLQCFSLDPDFSWVYDWIYSVNPCGCSPSARRNSCSFHLQKWYAEWETILKSSKVHQSKSPEESHCSGWKWLRGI